MRAFANSLRSRAFSASNSVTERAPGTDARLEPLAAATQFPMVPLGIPSRFAAASWDRPCFVTNFTASARISGV